MKRLGILLLTLLLLSWVGIDAKKRKHEKLKFPELNKFQIPEVKKDVTSNGIKLRLIRQDKLPLINVFMLLKGGSVYDPADKVGLANVTAQLISIGGTEKHKGEEIDEMLEQRGITVNVSAGSDYYIVRLYCLKENLEYGLQIMSEMLMSPGFDKEKLKEIKTKLSTDVAKRNDQPSSINSREFNRLIYGNSSPFAQVLEYAHLEKIKKSDIEKAYKRFFAPGNLLAGVIGPIEMTEVKGLFERYLGNWKHKTKAISYPKVNKIDHKAKVYFAEKANANQSYFSIGHLGITEDLKLEPAVSVFNSIFSQGFNSRLFKRVRTKMGLTYGIGGGILSGNLREGKTYFTSFTKSKTTMKAINAVMDEIKKIRTELVSDEELALAKDGYLNASVFKYSTPSQILSNEIIREFYNKPEGYLEKLTEDVKKVTREDVLRIAKTYLNPDKMVLFIVGKEKDLDGKLSDLGKAEKIDITIPAPPAPPVPEATPESLKKGKTVMSKLFKTTYKGYKRLRTMVTKMDMDVTAMGRKMTLGVVSTAKYPGKSHTEISVMGMKMTEVVNGESGMMNQMGRKIPITKEQIYKRRFASFYDMMRAKDKYSYQYLYEKAIKGSKYDVIYIFDKQKNWVKLYINQKSGYAEIRESISTSPQMPGLMKSVSSNFKVIKGLPVAFSVRSTIKGKEVQKMTIKEVNVNVKVADSLFKLKK